MCLISLIGHLTSLLAPLLVAIAMFGGSHIQRLGFLRLADILCGFGFTLVHILLTDCGAFLRGNPGHVGALRGCLVRRLLHSRGCQFLHVLGREWIVYPFLRRISCHA